VSLVTLSGGLKYVEPVLQAEDGSFVGAAWDDQANPYLVAFDETGSQRWSVAGDYWPKMALAGGGVVATLGYDGPAVVFDQNGAVVEQNPSARVQSWTTNTYQHGSVARLVSALLPYATSYAAFWGGSLSGSGTYITPYRPPQRALWELSISRLTARPQCDALLGRLAILGHVNKSDLVSTIQAVAAEARHYVYDGPKADMVLMDPIRFPTDVFIPGMTVQKYFETHNTAGNYIQGLSQVNGYATWYRLDDWHGWIRGFPSDFLKYKTGELNYYALGTVMHEILHKTMVGGSAHLEMGFRHEDMDDAILRALGSGWGQYVPWAHNADSYGIGIACFGDR